MTSRTSIILLIFLQSFACKNVAKDETVLIDGDLHFSYFRMTNLYGLPDSTAKRIIHFAETKKHLLPDGDSESFRVYDFLKKENFLYSPYVEMKLDNNSIITLFMNKEMYHMIAPTNYSQLVAAKKKIRIKAEAQHLNGVLYNCIKLFSIDTIDGETFMKSKKFAISDYR